MCCSGEGDGGDFEVSGGQFAPLARSARAGDRGALLVDGLDDQKRPCDGSHEVGVLQAGLVSSDPFLGFLRGELALLDLGDLGVMAGGGFDPAKPRRPVFDCGDRLWGLNVVTFL